MGFPAHVCKSRAIYHFCKILSVKQMPRFLTGVLAHIPDFIYFVALLNQHLHETPIPLLIMPSFYWLYNTGLDHEIMGGTQGE